MAEVMARRQFLATDDPGLGTADKIVSAVKRIVELAIPGSSGCIWFSDIWG